jgi:probable F420-dependent oxidoreductase
MMRVDDAILGAPLAQVGAMAAASEARGADGWLTGETQHDPFLICAMAAAATERIQIGTSIAVAFARSPMTTALAAHDLQALSQGRFLLGLGSQIKPHITKRFSMPWSQPAARMREYVLALRAIWDCWENGTRLAHDGEFYKHTLMTPFFTAPAHGFGAPPVFISAVGPLMTEVAGEVCDGIFCHGFTTARYLHEVTIPAVERGAERGGRNRSDVEVALPAFAISGYDDDQRAGAEFLVKSQIGFYGSTPAYAGVLELHGWGELHRELNAMTKRGEWDKIPAAIPDEVLEAFAVTAEPAELGSALLERFGADVDRLSLYSTFQFKDEDFARFREQVQA